MNETLRILEEKFPEKYPVNTLREYRIHYQRSDVRPSEKASAYKMLVDAILSQGLEPARTSPQRCGEVIAAHKVVAERGEFSVNTLRRLLRLNLLNPYLLDLIDKKEIGMTVGVDLSYLSQEAQAMLVRIMEQHGIKKLKGVQSAELKAAGPEPSEETILQVLGIFGEEKEVFPSLTIKPDFSGYAPSLVKRLKKSPAYLEGLQIAIQQFTDRYIQDFEKEATT